jgi:hypothetical protein
VRGGLTEPRCTTGSGRPGGHRGGRRVRPRVRGRRSGRPMGGRAARTSRGTNHRVGRGGRPRPGGGAPALGRRCGGRAVVPPLRVAVSTRSPYTWACLVLAACSRGRGAGDLSPWFALAALAQLVAVVLAAVAGADERGVADDAFALRPADADVHVVLTHGARGRAGAGWGVRTPGARPRPRPRRRPVRAPRPRGPGRPWSW